MDIFFMMAIKSIKKQWRRTFLVFLQLSIAFFSMSIAFGFIECTLDHFTRVKSMCDTKILDLYTYEVNGFQTYNLEESEKKILQKLYLKIKQNNMVQYMGACDYGYIKSDLTERPDSAYQNINLIAIDNDMLNMFNISNQNNTKLTYLSNKNQNKQLSAVINSNVIKSCSLGTIKKGLFDGTKFYSIKIVDVLKNKQYFFDSYGSNITDDIKDLNNSILVIYPKNKIPVYMETLPCNIFIKLRKNTNSDKFISYVNQLFKKNNVKATLHDVNFELKNYANKNKTPIIITISFSLIVLILATFGLVAVILLSILRRKKEFGIRYSIGATQINIIFLIIFEVLIVFLIANIVGHFFAFIVSKFIIHDIKIGLFTILASDTIMIMVSLITALIPCIKIMSLEPVNLIKRGKEY